MKKILSLALALLMLLPMAISTSAAKSSDDIISAEEFMDILEYWKWHHSDKDDYSDLYDYIYGSKYCPGYREDLHGIDREWYNDCETKDCDGWAFFYVSKGKIFYSCKKCGVTAESKLSAEDTTPDTICKYCNKTPCDCDIDADMTLSPEEELGWRINHGSKYCEMDDVTFRQYNKTIYWYCDNCDRYGSFTAPQWYDYFWDYDIRVLCSRGGSYDIDGRLKADHGDTRTITFDPDYGYVLYNVTVNGEDYGPAATLKLTITENTIVRAEFVKASSLKPCDLTATAIGNGTITAKKNGVKVAADEITAKYNDTVVYTFKPASSNYIISNVTVNGRSIGKVNTYSLTKGITKDVDIKVTFTWKNPYNDVADNYLNAVEYVTEAGIMDSFYKYVNTNAFSGKTEISVKSLAAALAEMADVNEKLDTIDERIEWAVKNAVIDESADLNALCTVQTACDIVNDYLALIEKASGLNFVDFDADDTAKNNALSIGLVKATTYTKNRTLTRYDLASVCYLLANLDVK